MNKLKQKSITGVIWKLIERGGIQLIKLVLGVILARLLSPEDYGLIGLITVFFVISMIFIDNGFGLAYIQKQDADEVDASTIFYLNMLTSFFLYGILWFSAPLIADFYEENRLISLIRVMSIVLIFNSFSLIQLAKLTKEIKFKKKTILVLVSAILASTAGIIAALSNLGVWSLVIQEITRAVTQSLGLWFFIKWRPLPYFRWNSLKSMFSYSSWAFVTGFFFVIFENINTIVIGKFFPAAQLGYYTKGNQFQGIITKTFSNAVGSVSFPVLSRLQNDKISLKNAFKKFIKHTMFFVVPISVIFIVIAKPFFLILLTRKWLPMVPYFQFLIIAGILFPITSINMQLLSVLGKMKLSFALSMIKNSLRVINLVLMYKYGVLSIIYGEIVLSFSSFLIYTFFTKKFINYGPIEQLKDISMVLITSIVLAVLGFWLINEFDSDYLKILNVTLFIGCSYLISMFFFDRKLFLENYSMIKGIFIKPK